MLLFSSRLQWSTSWSFTICAGREPTPTTSLQVSARQCWAAGRNCSYKVMKPFCVLQNELRGKFTGRQTHPPAFAPPQQTSETEQVNWRLTRQTGGRASHECRNETSGRSLNRTFPRMRPAVETASGRKDICLHRQGGREERKDSFKWVLAVKKLFLFSRLICSHNEVEVLKGYHVKPPFFF